MRALLVVLCLVLLSATATASRPLPEVPVRTHVAYTLPSEDCADCVGVSASAGTYVPDCYDCDGVGVGAGAEHDGDGTTATVRVCKSGFVYFCPVDEQVTV